MTNENSSKDAKPDPYIDEVISNLIANIDDPRFSINNKNLIVALASNPKVLEKFGAAMAIIKADLAEDLMNADRENKNTDQVIEEKMEQDPKFKEKIDKANKLLIDAIETNMQNGIQATTNMVTEAPSLVKIPLEKQQIDIEKATINSLVGLVADITNGSMALEEAEKVKAAHNPNFNERRPKADKTPYTSAPLSVDGKAVAPGGRQ